MLMGEEEEGLVKWRRLPEKGSDPKNVYGKLRERKKGVKEW